MRPLEVYLGRLHEIRAGKRGTPELSYRAALENLLNAVGETIDPEVQATHELKDTGAGRPDFGFFEAKSGNARGVVEVKPVEEDTPETADGAQVAKYWRQYGYVLVTNYRDFLLVVKEPDGRARVEGRYRLSRDAESFWNSKPASLAKEHQQAFTDFLTGVLTRAAPITRPRDLADDLARHAREAKRRLEQQDMTALAPLQRAMEQALGLHFEGKDGEAFFRSSLVQTLFYGLFSGWMLWREGRHQSGAFDWKDASDYLALPLIGDLYDEIARPKRLGDLGLREPLEWATNSLNRVDEQEFFKRFDADHAITLFYEPFLQAFDPKLRKELGVWYTPSEIVRYQVGRVDQLLRSELGIADGLADENVYVLDPAAGTASYLLETAKCIHRTLVEQGHGALAAAKVKKALCTRVFGFEILPAPYVVAHLQLGVLLRALGTSLAKDERCEVYLTNALTGWEPPKEPKSQLLFPELQKEAERAGRVKREVPILVILGNPPYNGFAGVALDEERDLSTAYRVTKRAPKPQGQGLNDLYVRFYRMAERRIVERSGKGIVCLISNYSWLDGLSFPGMREKYLEVFDSIRIDCMNGDKYKTGKLTPEGAPDPSVFSTEFNSEGIQVGTAIATLVRKPTHAPVDRVWFRHFWGKTKLKQLLDSLDDPNDEAYQKLKPPLEVGLPFTPGLFRADYAQWPLLPHLFRVSFPGVKTSRDDFLIDSEQQLLLRRLRQYFDAGTSHEEMGAISPVVMKSSKGFQATLTRERLQRRGLLQQNIVRYTYRPLDNRWLYWEPDTKLLDRNRPEYFPQVFEGNMFLFTTGRTRKSDIEPALVTPDLNDLNCMDSGARGFPLYLVPADGPLISQGKRPTPEPNLTEFALRYLAELSVTEVDLFYHCFAVLHSPLYRVENIGALRHDWPRVPLPDKKAPLIESAKLGRTVADLLLPDKSVTGVTAGRLRHELRDLGVPSKVGGGNINPAKDLKVDAGWGFRNKKNAVMCGKGKVQSRDHQGAKEAAVDVYINDKVYWANVPADVWTMTIGGYPVIKKWLSYREFKVLGRPLRLEEMTYITEVVRRLKALLLLGPELDANYRAVSERTLNVSQT